MTRASFRQADIERLIRAAEKTGAAVQVDLKTLVVTIYPGVIAAPTPASPLRLTRDGPELEDWSDLDEASKPRFGSRLGASASKPNRGASGYPIADDPTGYLQRWYDKIAFDPRTMGLKDMERLQAKAHAEWTAAIPGSKLGKREIKALKFLAAIGPNVKVHWRDVKDCGPDTEERLKIRGFLETFPQEKFPDRIGYYMLTDAGLEAYNKLS